MPTRRPTQQQDASAIQAAVEQLRRDLDELASEMRSRMDALTERMEHLAQAIADHSWHDQYAERLERAEAENAEIKAGLLGVVGNPKEPGLIRMVQDLTASMSEVKDAIKSRRTDTRQLLMSAATAAISVIVTLMVSSLFK